eukprot:scaffold667_cov168-Ochromonas_danica.AAC.12
MMNPLKRIACIFSGRPANLKWLMASICLCCNNNLVIFVGKNIIEQASSLRSVNKDIEDVLSKYEQRVDNTLRSYGISAVSFNNLSEYLDSQPTIRKRVLVQSYFYKIVADLEGNLRQALPVLPNLSKPEGVVKVSEGEVSAAQAESLQTSSSIRRFAQTLREIENCRLKIREKIKRDLNLRDLPPRMADPDYLPAMSPNIQKACADFPQIANRVITLYGFHVEEFNALQEKLDKNWLFRLRVQNEVKKIEKETESVDSAQ